MKRRLFTVLAAVSLLLCVATVALWVRSYSACDALVYTGDVSSNGEQANAAAQSVHGVMVLFSMSKTGKAHISQITFDRDNYQTHKRFEYVMHTLDAGERWEMAAQFPLGGLLSFGFDDLNMNGIDGGISSLTISVPDWFPVFILLILPAIWLLLRYRAARRIGVGCCAVCGYDLRATPDACPECGTIPQKRDQISN